MSKHVKNLRLLAEYPTSIYGMETFVDAAADALELAEAQNRVMRKALKDVSQLNCAGQNQPREAAVELAFDALEACRALAKKGKGKS